MGRRARGKGVTNAAVRAARAALREQDEELAAIAQRVYNAGSELKHDGEPEPLPLPVMAPLVVAAETVAPATLRLAGLAATDAMALDVAAYLVEGFREMAVMLDADHFREWQERKTAALAGVSDELPEEYAAERDSLDRGGSDGGSTGGAATDADAADGRAEEGERDQDASLGPEAGAEGGA